MPSRERKTGLTEYWYYEKMQAYAPYRIDDAFAQVEKGIEMVRVVNKNIELETELEASEFDKGLLKTGGAKLFEK